MCVLVQNVHSVYPLKQFSKGIHSTGIISWCLILLNVVLNMNTFNDLVAGLELSITSHDIPNCVCPVIKELYIDVQISLLLRTLRTSRPCQLLSWDWKFIFDLEDSSRVKIISTQGPFSGCCGAFNLPQNWCIFFFSISKPTWTTSPHKQKNGNLNIYIQFHDKWANCICRGRLCDIMESSSTATKWTLRFKSIHTHMHCGSALISFLKPKYLFFFLVSNVLINLEL